MPTICPTCQAENPAGAPFCAECGTRLATTNTPATPPAVTPAPTVLQDRYILRERLGQGGMGAVYRADDLRLSTTSWAIKAMSESAITGPLELQQAREAFRREAELLAGLTHPNLPRVVDHFEQQGKLYLVMELVAGETLLSYVSRAGLPRPLDEALGWFGQLCDVLEYLHSRTPPIIFRDLKPANVMISPEGRLRLIDFGIARLFTPGKSQDTQAYGTVGYSAPEQYGRSQTDARADVYSLGVLMHQLLTGNDPTQTPFRLPPARVLNPQLPLALNDVLLVATESDAAKRYATIATFRAAFVQASGRQLARPATAPAFARGNMAPAPPPIQPPPFPTTNTTNLANIGRWVGIGGLLGMAFTGVLLYGGQVSGGSESPLFTIGVLLAVLVLGIGPLGALLGLIALTRPITLQTRYGRSHALTGIIAGLGSLLLCCVIALAVGSVSGAS